jgi:hypothetical protein
MGQYWKIVNLDKRECVEAHKLGVGLKLGEQIGSGHGSPDALFILVAAMRGRRGGGDFDWDSNYYGPERTASREHALGTPINDDYNEVAKRTIGRWAGDRIAVVGDYSEDADLPSFEGFGSLYGDETLVDVTDDVARVIEHECRGTFVGDGWKEFKRG